MRTNDSRTLSIAALNQRRSQVAGCLRKGMTQKETGELCGMSEVTIRKIKKLYAAGGLKAVIDKKLGRPKGKGRTLKSDQEKDA